VRKLNLVKVFCVILVFCAATAIASPAQILTTLYSFAAPPGDNSSPYAGLVQASDGNFYGTASGGECCIFGSVFKITPSGALTTLYNFCSQSGCTDGAFPLAGLVQGTDGNFYGTTNEGGTGTCLGDCDGTVFKITPDGILTTLYSFCSQPDCADGTLPSTGLIQATDGNFYGTTAYGGANGLLSGTVFRITPSGTFTTLYNFCSQSDCSDGAQPSGLVQATDGNFYGTTSSGCSHYGCGGGTVFKITPSGTLTTLHSFSDAGGANPYAGLVQATDGNFYGTTLFGGASNNCDKGCGTVFKITPSGTLTTLHTFDGTDGELPYAGLIQATDGNFYGTTYAGGAYGGGTVFRLLNVRPCIVCPSVE
jgi:uncharacterized repeat protein (TIGR03803 family)